MSLRILNVVTDKQIGLQWRIQDFPGGGATPKVGVLTYYCEKKLPKTGWKRKNLDPEASMVPPPPDPPMPY